MSGAESFISSAWATYATLREEAPPALKATLEDLWCKIAQMEAPTTEDEDVRLEICADLSKRLSELGASLGGALSAEAHGSFVMGCYSTTSPLELAVTGRLPGAARDSSIVDVEQRSTAERLALLERVHRLVADSGMAAQGTVTLNRTARVPSVSFEHASSGIPVRVVIAYPNFALRSHILRGLMALEPRLRSLVQLVELWADARGLNNPAAGTFNSWALINLVLFAAQTFQPQPVLPPLWRVCTGVDAGAAPGMSAAPVASGSGGAGSSAAGSSGRAVQGAASASSRAAAGTASTSASAAGGLVGGSSSGGGAAPGGVRPTQRLPGLLPSSSEGLAPVLKDIFARLSGPPEALGLSGPAAGAQGSTDPAAQASQPGAGLLPLFHWFLVLLECLLAHWQLSWNRRWRVSTWHGQLVQQPFSRAFLVPIECPFDPADNAAKSLGCENQPKHQQVLRAIVAEVAASLRLLHATRAPEDLDRLVQGLFGLEVEHLYLEEEDEEQVLTQQPQEPEQQQEPLDETAEPGAKAEPSGAPVAEQEQTLTDSGQEPASDSGVHEAAAAPSAPDSASPPPYTSTTVVVLAAAPAGPIASGVRSRAGSPAMQLRQWVQPHPEPHQSGIAEPVAVDPLGALQSPGAVCDPLSAPGAPDGGVASAAAAAPSKAGPAPGLGQELSMFDLIFSQPDDKAPSPRAAASPPAPPLPVSTGSVSSPAGALPSQGADAAGAAPGPTNGAGGAAAPGPGPLMSPAVLRANARVQRPLTPLLRDVTNARPAGAPAPGESKATPPAGAAAAAGPQRPAPHSAAASSSATDSPGEPFLGFEGLFGTILEGAKRLFDNVAQGVAELGEDLNELAATTAATIRAVINDDEDLPFLSSAALRRNRRHRLQLLHRGGGPGAPAGGSGTSPATSQRRAGSPRSPATGAVVGAATARLSPAASVVVPMGSPAGSRRARAPGGTPQSARKKAVAGSLASPGHLVSDGPGTAGLLRSGEAGIDGGVVVAAAAVDPGSAREPLRGLQASLSAASQASVAGEDVGAALVSSSGGAAAASHPEKGAGAEEVSVSASQAAGEASEAARTGSQPLVDLSVGSGQAATSTADGGAREPGAGAGPLREVLRRVVSEHPLMEGPETATATPETALVSEEKPAGAGVAGGEVCEAPTLAQPCSVAAAEVSSVSEGQAGPVVSTPQAAAEVAPTHPDTSEGPAGEAPRPSEPNGDAMSESPTDGADSSSTRQADAAPTNDSNAAPGGSPPEAGAAAPDALADAPQSGAEAAGTAPLPTETGLVAGATSLSTAASTCGTLTVDLASTCTAGHSASSTPTAASSSNRSFAPTPTRKQQQQGTGGSATGSSGVAVAGSGAAAGAPNRPPPPPPLPPPPRPPVGVGGLRVKSAVFRKGAAREGLAAAIAAAAASTATHASSTTTASAPAPVPAPASAPASNPTATTAHSTVAALASALAAARLGPSSGGAPGSGPTLGAGGITSPASGPSPQPSPQPRSIVMLVSGRLQELAECIDRAGPYTTLDLQGVTFSGQLAAPTMKLTAPGVWLVNGTLALAPEQQLVVVAKAARMMEIELRDAATAGPAAAPFAASTAPPSSGPPSTTATASAGGGGSSLAPSGSGGLSGAVAAAAVRPALLVTKQSYAGGGELALMRCRLAFGSSRGVGLQVKGKGCSALADACHISGGAAAAVQTSDAALSLVNCTLSGGGGVGLSCRDNGSVTASDCRLGGFGGAAAAVTAGGSLELSGCQLQGAVVGSGRDATGEATSQDAGEASGVPVDGTAVGAAPAGGPGLLADGKGSTVVARGSTFSGFRSHAALVVTAGASVSLEECRVAHSLQGALVGTRGGRLLATRCELCGHAAEGLTVGEGATADLRDCRMRHNGTAGLKVGGVGCMAVLRECDTSHNGRSGLQVEAAGCATLDRCTAEGNGTAAGTGPAARETTPAEGGGGVAAGDGHGLYVGGVGARATAQRCTLLGNHGAGAAATAYGSVQLVGCILSGNGAGAGGEGVCGVAHRGQGEGVQVLVGPQGRIAMSGGCSIRLGDGGTASGDGEGVGGAGSDSGAGDLSRGVRVMATGTLDMA